MTLVHEVEPNSFVVWTGEPIDGVRYPLTIERKWPSDELAAIGLYSPAPADDIPAGKVSTGMTAQRVGGVVKWVHSLANATGPTLAERRVVLLSRLADKRWEVETGGVTVSGVPIRTDDVGQAKLTGAVALFDNDPELAAVDWEAQPGVWVSLDGATIRAVAVAVGRHIQACFSRARVVSEAIQAAHTHTLMSAAEAEIEIGWPGQ